MLHAVIAHETTALARLFLLAHARVFPSSRVGLSVSNIDHVGCTLYRHLVRHIVVIGRRRRC